MDSNRALPPEIEQALACDWVVLTANQRAARTLRHAFDLRQHTRGRAAWEPPAILAWETWTISLWNRLLLDGRGSHMLLSPAQERTIWHAVIAADAATTSLRPVDALAQTAADAWKLLHDYRGRPRLEKFPGNSDTRVFARWAAEFERRCSRAQYLTEAQLPETLAGHIDAGHLSAPDGILLVGFDNQTPAELALLNTVRAAGAEINELLPGVSGAPSVTSVGTPVERSVGDGPSPVADPTLVLASAPDEHGELAACAYWLRARLTAQSDASIAVIAPDIEADRAEIDRAFRLILAPELSDIAAPTAIGPYEFSLGVPLTRTPLVATALDILRWATSPLSLDRISALLLSPHFAAGHTSDERLARAEFDAFVLRQQHLLQPQLSIAGLLDVMSRQQHHPSLPVLIEGLRALRSLVGHRDFASERTHAEWTETIHELLEAAGWAPLAQLDSTEFQTRRKWDDTLDELATLDFDGTRVTFSEGLATLQRIANETLFAPESRHAPIQIMGPLESAGSAFDAIWFLRANDGAWPAAASPNPLLPWHLQRELDMPGASPNLHTARARRTTERIAATAPTVVFSHALESPDGPQRVSPVLANFALQSARAAELAPADPAPPRIELELLEDPDPIPAPPQTPLRGGASILQQQAACAFRAFAEKRLFSDTPEAIELGLDARERGTLVHSILERFWSELQTQNALRALPRGERDDLLRRSIDAALAKQDSHVEPGWPEAYFATERHRLFRLLSAWLDFELTRAPFAVRATEEKLNNIQIGPLHLDVRVDRVDTHLIDGKPAGEIILDYKTGNAVPAEWLGKRPDEPQLPLYAVVSGSRDIAAIAFASVRPGSDSMGLKGFQSRDGVLSNPTRLKNGDFDTHLNRWRDDLTALATDFYSGDARVSPKKYPSTCRNCEQRLLCRLNLEMLEPDANEDFLQDSDRAVDTLADPADSGTEAELG